ncbi:MAG: hypothetical protein AAGA30_00975, partial [Planctomycetota bacterium]
EEIKSARNGLGGFLIAGFSVGRTCQIFSRKPGTCGRLLLGAWVVGIGIQWFYFTGHVDKYGPIDATPFELLLLIQAVLWVVDCISMLAKKRQPGDKELGVGLLSNLLPKSSLFVSGLISDVVTGLAIYGLLIAVESPVQANWYLAITVWIVFCHFCIAFKAFTYRQRVRAAVKRSKRWRKDVKGRHYV